MRRKAPDFRHGEYVKCIEKVCKQKFVAFSDEINKHFKTDLSIELPIQSDECDGAVIDASSQYHEDGYIPDWDYMEKYIQAIEEKVYREIKEGLKKTIEAHQSVIDPLNTKSTPKPVKS